MILFPPPTVKASLLLAGVSAAPPWGSDEGDLDGGNGWGASSRSSLRVDGKFTWTGGMISGNARVSEGHSLYREWGWLQKNVF